MSFFRMVLGFVASMLVTNAWAESSCGTVTTYQDVLICAERRSSDVQKAESFRDEMGPRVDVATQLPNPELAVDSMSGTANSNRVTETNLSLAFPIEWGGKRQARKQVAEAELNKADYELLRTRSEVRKTALLNLIRLRQALSEKELLEEALETFTKLVKQYESRPARSPEQEVTLTVFKIAKGEYSLKRTESDEEIADLEAYFKVNTGLGLSELKKVLPPKVTKWPKLPTAENIESSLLLSGFRADIQLAEGQLNEARSEAWPTLRLGPSAKFTNDSSQDLQQWGANLSLTLPLFHLNGAGKKAAGASKQSAELRQDLALKQLQTMRETTVRFYETAVAALRDALQDNSLEEKHHKLEVFFMKGVVSSALVIEAHRSLLEFSKLRNDREGRAIEAYLKLQIIDGRPVEFSYE